MQAQPISQELDAERDASGRPTGRLNHPVLFVHGYAENATGFGVQFGEEICADPKVKSSPISKVVRGPDASFGNWPIDLVTDLVLLCRDGAEPHVTRTDRITTVTTVQELLRAGGGIVVQHADRTSVLGRSFFWADWAKEYADLRVIKIDSQTPVKIKHAQHRQFDRLMSYSSGSIPDILARSFSLDRTWDPRAPDTRINRNGIYAFNAKMDTPSGPVVEDCRDPRLELANTEVVLHNSGDRAPPLEVGMMTVERMYFDPVFHYSARLACSDGFSRDLGPSTRKLTCSERPVGPAAVPSASAPTDRWNVFVDAVNRVLKVVFVEPRFVVGAKPLVCTGGDDQFSATNSPDLSKLGAATAVKLLMPKKTPDWQAGSGTKVHPGQAQDLYNRMKEVLDLHYGVGNWQSDPAAQIDLVAHSQGGLVVRAMISAAQAKTDTSWGNPIRHLRRVVTLGTPHFGTAIATPTYTLRDAVTNLDASLGQRNYLALADMKDRSGLGACKLPSVTPLPEDIKLEELRIILERQKAARDAFLDAPPAGCLALRAELPVYVDKALWDFVTDPFVTTPANGFHIAHLYLVGPLIGPWKLIMTDFPMVQIPDKSIGAKGIQEMMTSMAGASHLGWPDGLNFVEKVLGRDGQFPRYPGFTDKIPFYTFASPGVGSFVSDVFQSAIKNLKAGCPYLDLPRLPIGYVPTSGPILFNVHNGVSPS